MIARAWDRVDDTVTNQGTMSVSYRQWLPAACPAVSGPSLCIVQYNIYYGIVLYGTVLWDQSTIVAWW